MDRDLVERAQAGDLAAFEALASASHPRLYRAAFGILRDSDRAQDATQQALVEIWKHVRGLRAPEAYERWSYRITVRMAVAEAERSARWTSDTMPEVHPAPGAVADFETIVHRDQLERGFHRISVEHRAVIVMRHLLDLSYEEIAEALGVAPGTVASRLYRAMEALRGAIEADDRPPVELRSIGEAE